MLPTSDDPIDAVYLWVDGSDPEHLESLKRFSSGDLKGDTTGGCRFRDNGELKYSLRSLERHAPWVRHVYIIHAGKPPAWIDSAHPDLRLIRHEDIFPDTSVLPTFNSYAIELNLHRIAGLSRRFLYLNDDFFLARDTPLSWFIPSDGPDRFFFEENPIPLRGDFRSANDKACAYTLTFHPWRGPHRGPAVAPSRTGWRRLVGIPPRRNMTAHVPQIYDRERIRELEKRFPAEFKATRAHRFRSPDDLALRILYAYSGLSHGQLEAVGLNWDSADCCFVRLGEDLGQNRIALNRVESERPRFVCANDDVDSEDPNHPVLLLWKDAMARCWPERSRFEI